MQVRSIVVLLVLVVFASAAAHATSTQSVGASASQAATAKVKEDFSTPKAAVETFFAAAAARDVDVLSRCFAETSPAEFDALRKKQLSRSDLDAVAKQFGVGKVINVEQDEKSAVVAVKLSSRDERIKMTRIGSSWKILDF
jgi:hypothetical protein